MGADVPPEFGKQYDLLEKWAEAALPQGKSKK